MWHTPVSFAYGAGVDCARTVTNVATKTPSVAPLNMVARTPSRMEGECIVWVRRSVSGCVQLKHTHDLVEFNMCVRGGVIKNVRAVKRTAGNQP